MWGVSLPDFSDIQKLGSQLGEVLQTAKNELDKNLDQLAQGANASDGGGDELLLTGLCVFWGRLLAAPRPRVSVPQHCIIALAQSPRCSRPLRRRQTSHRRRPPSR